MKHQIMTVMLDAFLIINALPLSFCKNASPTFSMVHLLHRLYGVDAPVYSRKIIRHATIPCSSMPSQSLIMLTHFPKLLQVNKRPKLKHGCKHNISNECKTDSVFT